MSIADLCLQWSSIRTKSLFRMDQIKDYFKAKASNKTNTVPKSEISSRLPSIQCIILPLASSIYRTPVLPLSWKLERKFVEWYLPGSFVDTISGQPPMWAVAPTKRSRPPYLVLNNSYTTSYSLILSYFFEMACFKKKLYVLGSMGFEPMTITKPNTLRNGLCQYTKLFLML